MCRSRIQWRQSVDFLSNDIKYGMVDEAVKKWVIFRLLRLILCYAITRCLHVFVSQGMPWRRSLHVQGRIPNFGSQIIFRLLASCDLLFVHGMYTLLSIFSYWSNREHLDEVLDIIISPFDGLKARRVAFSCRMQQRKLFLSLRLQYCCYRRLSIGLSCHELKFP